MKFGLLAAPKMIAALAACTLVLLIGATTLAAPPVQARAIIRHLDIPAQALGEALKALSAAADEQLLFSDEVVTGRRSNPVKGDYSTEDALEILLQGSGLKADRTKSGVFLIRSPASTTTTRVVGGTDVMVAADTDAPYAGALVGDSSADSTSPHKKGSRERIRLAQTEVSSETDSSSLKDRSSSTDSAARLDEIVVTADRVGEKRLQDVPISISVLSSEELDRTTTSTLFENLSRVPGVVISEHAVAGAQVPIRGVAASTAILNGSSPTAFYFDGVPFGFVRSAVGPNPSPYDLERVEVLRGPQGTLYGASALNGVVRIMTEEADPTRFDLKSRFSTSATEGGGNNYRGDAAVNVPIIKDRFAARAVVGYQDWSGWIDKPNEDDANDAELLDARLKLKAQPTEQLSIGLNAWLSRYDWGAPALADDEGRHPSPRDMPTDTDSDLYALTIDYDAPSFSISSVSSYIDYANESWVDLAPQIPLPANGVVINSIFSNETFAQELLLHSTHEGNWRWSAGGIYRDSEDGVYQILPGITPQPIIVSETSSSYAVFGQLTRVFAGGEWEFTGGLRYFHDRYGSTVSSPVVVPESTTDFHATTPRAVLTWYPSSQLTVYGSYSEGFRSGLEQTFLTKSIAPFLPPLEPDSLRNYEVGLKGNAWEGRFSFDTAVYFIDWQDIQQDTIVGFIDNGGVNLSTNALLNGESASGLGVDLGVTLYPTDGLELGATFSWNDLTMDSDVFSGGLLVFSEGERINFSSEYTAGAFAEYDWLLGNGLQLQFSASANYTSGETHKQVTAASFAGGQVLAIPSDDLLISRASLSLLSPGRWTATLYGDNINNEDGSPFKARSNEPWFSRRITPRVVGVQFQFEFGGR